MKNITKTPTILQMDATECGVVCLQIILAYYGVHESKERLRELCGVSRDGVNSDNLQKAAQVFNFETDMLFADCPGDAKLADNITDLLSAKRPYIIHWQFNHFVVFEGVKNNRFYLNDPASGRYSVDFATFSNNFTGVVIELTPNANFKKYGQPTRLWSGLLKRTRNHHGKLILAVLISLIMLVPGVIIPTMSQIYIDNIIVNQQQHWLAPLLWTYGALVLFELGLIHLQFRVLLYVQIVMSIEQSRSFIRHLLKLPIPFFESRFAGDLSERVASNDQLTKLLSSNVITVLVNIVAIGVYGLVLTLISPLLAGITVVLTLITFIIMANSSHKLREGSLLYAQSQGALIGATANAFQIIETQKLQASENLFFKRWQQQHDKTLTTFQAMQHKVQIAMMMPNWLDSLNTVVVLMVGVNLVMDNQLTLGGLVAFNALKMSFVAPLKQLANTLVSFKRMEGLMVRLDDVLCLPVETEKKCDNEITSFDTFEACDLSFGYHSLADSYLKSISIQLQKGERIAIVGGAGSGKSTLIKCLSGSYTPWSGAVLLNNIPLTELAANKRSKAIAVVSQQVTLFDGTVRDNIRLWDTEISDEDIIKACETADVYHELGPRGGLNAMVNNGGDNFSSGQRQRIAIARAIVTQPDFLILDEATSLLDTLTEKNILDAISTKEFGIITCAHRLSTVKDCDQIYVMDKGEIVESGTHVELLSMKGHYHALITQAQGGENG